MFSPASPGVVIGDMVVLAKEGLEAPIRWEESLVAVAQVPFPNLVGRQEGHREVTINGSPDA